MTILTFKIHMYKTEGIYYSNNGLSKLKRAIIHVYQIGISLVAVNPV